jgi:hypothetical protein
MNLSEELREEDELKSGMVREGLWAGWWGEDLRRRQR